LLRLMFRKDKFSIDFLRSINYCSSITNDFRSYTCMNDIILKKVVYREVLVNKSFLKGENP